MHDFEVKILQQSSIDELITRFPQFGNLSNKKITQREKYRWVMGEKIIYCFQVIFIGKTGYGKSTTINKLIGRNLFDADDFVSCTKELYAIEYQLNALDDQYFFSIGDLPGVGESVEADELYLEYYRNFINKASIVVYMLRADQRDFSIDLDIFKSLFLPRVEKDKVVIGLNFVDKLQPLHTRTPFTPSIQQQINLHAKVEYISSFFDIEVTRIACFSALENYQLNDLATKIQKRVSANIASGIIR